MSKNHDVSDFVLLGLVLGLITDIGQCAFQILHMEVPPRYQVVRKGQEEYLNQKYLIFRLIW